MLNEALTVPLPHSFLIKVSQHVGTFLDLIYGDVEMGDRECRLVATGPLYLGHSISVPRRALSRRWGLEATENVAVGGDNDDDSTAVPTPLMRVGVPIVLGELVSMLQDVKEAEFGSSKPECMATLSRILRLVQLAIALYGIRSLLRAAPRTLVSLPPTTDITVTDGKVSPSVAQMSIEAMLADLHADLPAPAAITLDVLSSLRTVSSKASATGGGTPQFTRVTQKVNVLLLCLGGLSGQLLTLASELAGVAMFVSPVTPLSTSTPEVTGVDASVVREVGEDGDEAAIVREEGSSLRIDADTCALIRELTGEVVNGEVIDAQPTTCPPSSSQPSSQAPIPSSTPPPLTTSQEDWFRAILPANHPMPQPGYLRAALDQLLSTPATTPKSVTERIPAAQLLLEVIANLGGGLDTAAQTCHRAEHIKALQSWLDAEELAKVPLPPPTGPVDPFDLDFSPRTHARHTSMMASHHTGRHSTSPSPHEVSSSSPTPQPQQRNGSRCSPNMTAHLMEVIEQSQRGSNRVGDKRQRDDEEGVVLVGEDDSVPPPPSMVPPRRYRLSNHHQPTLPSFSRVD